MNIYVTNIDPSTSALWIDDAFVDRAINEAVRIMSTVIRVINKDVPEGLYGKLHPEKPICQWVASSISAFEWTLTYTIKLLERSRYCKDRKRVEAIIYWFQHNYFRFKRVDNFDFINCAFDKKLKVDHTDQKDVTAAYRTLQLKRWSTYKENPKWDTGFQPNWYTG